MAQTFFFGSISFSQLFALHRKVAVGADLTQPDTDYSTEGSLHSVHSDPDETAAAAAGKSNVRH